MRLTRRLAPALVEAAKTGPGERGTPGQGAIIINVGSTWGIDPMVDFAAYTATKFAMRGWSLCNHRVRHTPDQCVGGREGGAASPPPRQPQLRHHSCAAAPHTCPACAHVYTHADASPHTHTPAQELGAHNVKVVLLAPGLVDTPMTAGLPLDKQRMLQVSDVCTRSH
jgi:NAD(P)-dependent dehydrogenase (short-subunit alcohol dehydrogenase family)